MKTEENGKNQELTESKILKTLDYAYEKAITTGIPGLGSAIDMAESYKDKHPGDKLKQANDLINWQVAKAATSGFITGLGGLITIPVALPANLLSVMYIQVNMIAAIAYLGGYDLKDDKVKTLVFACMVGDAVKILLKNAGMEVGKKIALKMLINRIPGSVLVRINRIVGFRLLTKFGEKGVINLGKMVPIFGGLIGGTMDAVWTKGVGKAAKWCFIESHIADDE